MRSSLTALPKAKDQPGDGRTRVQIRIEKEIVWLTQKQMAELFRKDILTVSEHIGNIFEEVELQPDSVVRNFRIAASDAKHSAFGGQGALFTTADFQGAAADVALEPDFACVGLIHGRQLVDLLIERWSDIPPESRERLGLKPGLVRT